MIYETRGNNKFQIIFFLVFQLSDCQHIIIIHK